MSLFATKPVATILEESEEGEHSLKRTLGAWSLIALGIGAVIGAGIFTLAGSAAANHAGPSIVLSFIVAGIGCAFAGLCYSEFATMIPVAGSAYTYAYATMGELLAWIIGWDLVLEYALGAATVSVGWSGHVVDLLHRFNIHLPPQFTASPFEMVKLADGSSAQGLMNLPALFIIVLVSLILIRGISESATVNSVIVVAKVAVVLIFIGLGWSYIDSSNHHPFIPANSDGVFGHFGISGILRGSGVIFFAYIGFDAISTAAQEAKKPQRDMPIGIIGSLTICTLLFILYSFVLTGIVNYKDLNVSAPITLALARMPYPSLAIALDLAIIAGLTSVILVMLLGQSRVFYAMSRDGLLWRIFSDVHPTFRTPWRSNLLLMVFVGILSTFTPIGVLGEMTSIGTLFAFILVCGGIMVMRRTNPNAERPFRTPWVPLVPILGIIFNFTMMFGLGLANWLRLFVWLAIGLAIYFTYSRSHSKLAHAGSGTPNRPTPTLGK